MSIEINFIKDFNISKLYKYPFMQAVGYYDDDISNAIVFPGPAHTFNLNEFFVYGIDERSIIVYFLYFKTILLIRVPHKIQAYFVSTPSFITLRMANITFAVDCAKVKQGTVRYVMTEEPGPYFQDEDFTITHQIRERRNAPRLKLNALPSRMFTKDVVLTKEGYIMKVVWDEQKKVNLYYYNEVHIKLEAILVIFDNFVNMIPIFLSLMEEEQRKRAEQENSG